MKQTMGLIQNILTIGKRIGGGRILILLFLILLSGACSSEKPTPEDAFNVSGVILPKSIDTEPKGDITLTVIGGKGPAITDVVRLQSSSGSSSDCRIIACNEKSFTFHLNDDIVSGTYTFSIVRTSEVKTLGKVILNITSSIVVEPGDGMTVYGLVLAGGKPVSGVVMSDGYEVVVTDENGFYQMPSRKQNGYVFVSVPSGYEPQTDGVLPLIHKSLVLDPEQPERVDFNLEKVEGQDNYKLLVLGDLHLAGGKQNDLTQFKKFVSDVNDYVAGCPGEKFYALTLGDMTWDIYWVTRSYNLQNYLNEVGMDFSFPVWNTIGNHDHSCYLAGDFGSSEPYRTTVAPTYYSFNIGQVHYIVLDDIVADNTGNYSDSNNGRRHYERISEENVNWLKKDLAHVDKSTPVVVSMHAPLYNDSGSYTLDNGSALTEALAGYEVQLMTGHTHKIYNVEKNGFYEHNSGAVCATWWWTGYLYSGLHIAQDGAPGGYRVVDVKGKTIKSQFKATGKPLTHQFRTYDRNTIQLSTSAYLPNGSVANQVYFTGLASDWITAKSDNIVYINIWDYDSGTRISVTENGKELPYSRVSMRDPLHLAAYSAKRLDSSSDVSSLKFATSVTKHFFEVKASSANSTLEITVKDRFGNVSTETMTRPKQFKIENYK